MYITCSNCQTTFIVSDKQIGEEGKRVKCSKCNHIWYQKLDLGNVKSSEAQTSSDTGTIPSGDVLIRVPALLPRQSKKRGTLEFIWWSVVIFCILIFFYTFSEYDKLEDIKNVVIRDDSNGGVLRVVVEASNEHVRRMSAPQLRIRITDKDHKVIEECISNDIDMRTFTQNETVHIATTIPSIANAKYLDISIGNRLGFLIS